MIIGVELRDKGAAIQNPVEFHLHITFQKNQKRFTLKHSEPTEKFMIMNMSRFFGHFMYIRSVVFRLSFFVPSIWEDGL